MGRYITKAALRFTTKLVAVSAVCLGALGLTPNAASAEDLQPPIPASFACEFFKPHTGDTRWIAAWIQNDGESAFDVANCAAIHPGGESEVHFYQVTRWWNGQWTWNPGCWCWAPD